MLRNPFYYGKFEYPVKSGIWYKGGYPPLVTKEVFDIVQNKLTIPRVMAKWGSKKFTFQKMLKCGTCGRPLICVDKHRYRKWSEPLYHVYYYCSRPYNKSCTEQYISEDQIIRQLKSYIQLLKPETTHLTEKFESGLKNFEKMRNEILLARDIDPELHPITFREYAMYILQDGSTEEKRELLKSLAPQFYIHNRKLCTSRKNDMV